MKNLYILATLFLFSTITHAQCYYVAGSNTTNDTVGYTFVGGTFASYGCAPIDPNYWMANGNCSANATFLYAMDYPTLRVWGMNDDDSAFVEVNGLLYPLNNASAHIYPKVVCGLSPGPDGVIFANGKMVGANSNELGNYSYQDVQLLTEGVYALSINGVSGAGWGFAGISLFCPAATDVTSKDNQQSHARIYPNPSQQETTVEFGKFISSGEITLSNTIGDVVFSASIKNTERFVVYRNTLPAGIYFISVRENDEMVFTGKWLVKE
jgi:hypothetical protein